MASCRPRRRARLTPLGHPTDGEETLAFAAVRRERFRIWFLQAIFFHSTVMWGSIVRDSIASPADGVAQVEHIFIALLLFATALRALRLRVEADDHGLWLFNYFSTKHVPWSEITHVEAGYFGLEISCTGERRVLATGVTRTDVPWQTKADRVARYLSSEANRRRG